MDEDTKAETALNLQLNYLVQEQNLLEQMIRTVDDKLNKLKVEEMALTRKAIGSGVIPNTSTRHTSIDKAPVSMNAAMSEPQNEASVNAEPLELDVSQVLMQLAGGAREEGDEDCIDLLEVG